MDTSEWPLRPFPCTICEKPLDQGHVGAHAACAEKLDALGSAISAMADVRAALPALLMLVRGAESRTPGLLCPQEKRAVAVLYMAAGGELK